MNLSSQELDKDCRSLLSKGCKFTPHPKQDMITLQDEVTEFCRNIRIIDYFKDTPSIPSDLNLKYNRSNFVPPRGVNLDLDAILNLLDKKVSEYTPRTTKTKHNLTRNEFNILNNLQKDRSLHITRADKGGAFVILDNEFYLEQMKKEHTSDVATYKRIDSYTPHSTMEKISTLCKRHKTDCGFTKKELDFINKFTYDLPFLYGLPKIHKIDSSVVGRATPDEYGYIHLKKPSNLRFRPIISSSYAPTSRISAFIDEILKPLVPGLRSYCRDTYHFLEKLAPEREIKEQTLLTSFDVVSLYTSIPHELGMESIQFWLERRGTVISNRFSDVFILSSLELILKNNYFRFGDEIFLQISGTAMGTKMAPTYAILVMGFLEEKMYTRIKAIYNDQIADKIICGWLRYIDDCWIPWKGSYGPIASFIQILESLHPSIRFTLEISDLELHFLDVRIYKEGDRFETDIYHKPTDSRSYVPFTSAHPKHILNNIPFSLARRIHTIVSNPVKIEEQLKELKDILIRLNYPTTLIENAFLRANRQQSVENKRKVKGILPFISTFNRNNPNIYKEIISPAYHSLGLMIPFNNFKLIRAFRQPKSLLQLLNNNKKESFRGITRCEDSRCGSCESLITGEQITFTSNDGPKTFKIKSNMNCLSLNVIYALICRGCNNFYIGQTGGMFRKRLTLHRQHINNLHYAILDVSKHIATCAKNRNPPFLASPILKLPARSTKEHRERKERAIIAMLRPQLNKD